MGRPSFHPVRFHEAAFKFHLIRLKLLDGCYDSGGAYWGGPNNVYRVLSTEKEICLHPWEKTEVKRRIEFFFRADSRDLAKAKVLERYPNAKFFR